MDMALGVSTICRICLNLKDEAAHYSLYQEQNTGKQITDLLIYYAEVKASKDDKLPQSICKKCLFKLISGCEFRKQIIDSDKKLRKKFATEEILIKTEINDVKILATSNFDNAENTIQSLQQIDEIHNITSENRLILENMEDIGYVEIIENHTADTSCDKKESVNINLLKTEKGNNKVSKNRTRLKVRAGGKLHPVKCDVCNKIFKNQYYYRTHYTMHTGDMSHVCNVCKRPFINSWMLKSHMRIHTNEHPFACKVCGKSYKYISSLSYHELIHTGDRPFKCDVCGKSFTHKSNYNTHKRIHTDEKTFICEICSNSFLNSVALQRHQINIHKNERNFACELCDKKFKTKYVLAKHNETHSGAKPYSCNICSKKFTVKGSLTIHMRIHNGVKPHSCRVCGKTFRQSNCVVRHMRIHTGETPYSCNICPKKFAYSQHLLSHMKMHANDNDDQKI